MRLQNCGLEIDHFRRGPLVIERAEGDWVQARDQGLIPEALFRFYCTANYFSFGQSPPYFRDGRNILFPYLGSVTRGVRVAMEEAHDLLEDLCRYHDRSYTPIKAQRGEDWDPRANTKEVHSFKYLIMNLSGALDMFAEVVALFFPGEIQDLSAGSASFTNIKRFLERPLPPATGIVSPRRHNIEGLYAALRPFVECGGPERQWFDLFYLYRNKMAHLGNFMFLQMSLQGLEEENFYTFLPNRWPLIPEEHIRPGTRGPRASGEMREYLERSLVHQDVIQYSGSLIQRIADLLERGFQVLCEAYEAFRELPLNQETLAALDAASRSYAFRHF